MLTSPLFLALSLGGLLAAFAAAPVLIHLINMLRHRRVKWAAMDFLLQSYKKHRNWIWLKQLLLLAMRMAVIVLIALMLCTVAHFLLDRFRKEMGWGSDSVLFAGVTHHYVILDDSYSMSELDSTGSAFERAKEIIVGIGESAAKQRNQKFTLLRYSGVMGRTLAEGDEGAGRFADLSAVEVDAEFDLLKNTVLDLKMTQLSVQPDEALQVVKQLVSKADQSTTSVVYLVSDFRSNKWDKQVKSTKVIEELQGKGANVHLVSCAKKSLNNLGIVDIKPLNMTRAAGVPLFVDVTVKNYGQTVQKKVQLKVQTAYYDPQKMTVGDPKDRIGEEDRLPVFVIDEIPPGKEVTRQAHVYFPEPGYHAIEAILPEDSVAADNRRWSVVEFPENENVLIIGGGTGDLSAYYLSAFFKPGERANTGIQPQVETVAFLRDAKPDDLKKDFRAIYLMDVDRLDNRAIETLKGFVREGGGLAFFGGPNVAAGVRFYNEKLYEDGEGLFPVPLERLQTDNLLVSDPDEDSPDLQSTSHPILKNMVRGKNSLLSTVRVERFLQVQNGWKPSDETVKVALRLRGGAPLMVEQSFGEGRVLAFLSTMTPDWNNLATGPMIGMALDLHSYLAANRRKDDPKLVGEPIVWELDEDKYLAEVDFVMPKTKPAGSRIPIALQAEKDPQEKQKMIASLGSMSAEKAHAGTTERQGIYDGWRTTSDDREEVKRWAVNVDPAEGEIAVIDPKQLPDSLKASFLYWDEYDPQSDGESRDSLGWTKYILYALIGLLLLEQMMAYWTSYHPVRGGAR